MSNDMIINKITIYSLPIEVLIQIFGYLETATLQSVASISPYFNNIINDDNIWRVLFIKKLHHIEDTVDVNTLPGKRKYANNQLSINNENLIKKNDKVLTYFPSLSNSFLWKTEFFIRFAYLRKFLNINKNNKKSSSLKDLHKLNPHFVTSAYKIQSNYLIDDFHAEYYNDKLLTYSSTTHNLNMLGLKQGKHAVQVSSFIDSKIFEDSPELPSIEHPINNLNYFPTVEKLCKNLLMIGTSSGHIFIKKLNNNEIPLNIIYSESKLVTDLYFNKHEVINNYTTEDANIAKLIKKKLLISCADYNPSLNINQKDPNSRSLDFITGDLLGQIYLWNFHAKNELLRLDVNSLISHEQLALNPEVRLPILKIQSDYKKYIVIQSINDHYVLILFDSNYKIVETKVLKIIPERESSRSDIMLLWELFNNTSTHLVNELTPNFFISKIINPPQVHKKSFMEVDYTNGRIFATFHSKIVILNFDGYNQEILETRFENEKYMNSLTEFVIQTKIINNMQKIDGNLTSRYHAAGGNCPLFIALYSSGKIVIYSPTSSGNSKTSNGESSSSSVNTVIFKVIPSFLSKLVANKNVDDLYASYGILPILKIDSNNAILMLTSYNGWVAFVNILNGNILKVFEDKIPRGLLNLQTLLPYRVSVDIESEGNHIRNTAVLVPVTALKLFQYPVFTRAADTQDLANYNWKSILLNGVIIFDNIVVYFQVSFENSVLMKNTLQLSEEVLQLQKQSRKVKNPKQVVQAEIMRNIKDQVEEFNYNREQMKLLDKVTEKFNGVEIDENDEELMLAIALSNSITESVPKNSNIEENHDNIKEFQDVIERSKIEAFQHQKFLENEKEIQKALELSKLDDRRYILSNGDDGDEDEDVFFGLSKTKFKLFSDPETSNSVVGDMPKMVKGSKGKQKLLVHDVDFPEEHGKVLKLQIGSKESISKIESTNNLELDDSSNDLKLAIELSLKDGTNLPNSTTTLSSQNKVNELEKSLSNDEIQKKNNDDLTIDEALVKLRLERSHKSKKFAKSTKGKLKYKALDLSKLKDEHSDENANNEDFNENDDLQRAFDLSMNDNFLKPNIDRKNEYFDNEDELQRILELSKIEQ